MLLNLCFKTEMAIFYKKNKDLDLYKGQEEVSGMTN